MSHFNRFRVGTIALAVHVLLSGCGGGSDSNPPAAMVSTLRGQAYIGPTVGAKVCAYRVDAEADDGKGEQVLAASGSGPLKGGCVGTDGDGRFSLVLPPGVSGELLVESTGGVYCSGAGVVGDTTCADGEAVVQMGGVALRSIVTTPVPGAVSDVPMTLLTTAAASRARGSAGFISEYSSIAQRFQLGGLTPYAQPLEAGLVEALSSLSIYLGRDTALLDEVVAAIGTGEIGYANRRVKAAAELVCSPLAGRDTKNINRIATCRETGDGVLVASYSFENGALASLLTGMTVGGEYSEARYTGSCSDMGDTLSRVSTRFTMEYKGIQVVERSASSNPLWAQEGSASMLKTALAAGGTLDLPQTVTRNHLFCRTSPATATDEMKGYLTLDTSPMKAGSLSRFDVSSPAAGWVD